MLRRLAPKMGVVCLSLVAMAAPPAPRFLPAEPTVSDITMARVFEGLLVPVGGQPTAAENRDLGAAIEAYRAKGSSENFEPFLAFAAAHPQSPWMASLRCNLGSLYYHGGYFTKALDAWDEAYALTRDSKDPQADAVRATAIKELLDLNARVGRVARVKELLDEAAKRAIPGWMNESVQGAREGLWLMEHKPERAFRCGPLGLAMIKQSLGQPFNDLYEVDCTPKGTSLASNQVLAAKVGLDLQMAKREPGAPLLLPALVHWKAGHYAALVQQEGDRFLVKDPTFGEEFWVSRRALDEELSGYALVAKGTLPKGWSPLSKTEGDQVWGRGSTPSANQNATNCSDDKRGGAASGCDGSGACTHPGLAKQKKMPSYSFHSAVVSLHIEDTPVGYDPSVGPAVWFGIVYNQREVRRGAYIDFASVGAQWTTNWDSYVVDDPGIQNVGAQTIRMYDAWGGSLSYSGYNSANVSWKPHPKTHETMGANTDRAHPVYTRNLVDGYKLVYSSPDASTTYPRRVYLSQVVDPQGNAVTLHYVPTAAVMGYGAQLYMYASDGPVAGGIGINLNSGNTATGLLLDSITDAQGLVTHIESQGNFITKVTDPFGRSASFTYAAGELDTVTDQGGLTSSFTYGYVYDQAQDRTTSGLPRIDGMWATNGCSTCSGKQVMSLGTGQVALPNFLTSMTTPYGTTTFDMWENGTQRAIQATDPMGFTERLEFRHQAPGFPASEPYSGGGVDNVYQDWRNTFYWNKRTFQALGRDYSQAQVLHWLHGLDGEFNAPTLESERDSLDRRVWYGHDGTFSYYNAGEAHPTAVTRIMENGTVQSWQYAYNAQGKATQTTDPLGRIFAYAYTADGLDLLSARNKTAGANELLATYTYDAKHRPLTAKDASGQVTTMTYNDLGQLLTTTNPKGQTTTFTYTDAKLTGIQGPDPASTVAFAYDGYGRVATVTDAEGRSVHTDYDLFDRPTQVTYPDGTFEQFTYDRLDLVKTRDRKGNVTVMTYNPLRQMTDVMDSAGRTTHFDWCSCGALESMLDPAGHHTTWIRDLQSRVLMKVYDDQTANQYAYDANGRLAQRVDALGQATAYTYNLDNSLAKVEYANTRKATPSVAYTYDAKYPRLATMTDGVGTTTFQYNAITTTPALGAGRLLSVDGPWANDTLTYAYDELGRTISRSLNGTQETRAFDALGRLTTVVNPLGTFSYAYQGATGRLDHVTAGNGMTTSFAYDASPNDRRVTQISHQKADGTPISTFGYTYDLDGQIKTWTQSADGQAPRAYAFDYDAVGQVMSGVLRDSAGQLIHSYTYGYDLAGNRTSEEVDGRVTTSQHNSVNQLVHQSHTVNSQSIQTLRASALQRQAQTLRPSAKVKGPQAPKAAPKATTGTKTPSRAN